MATFTAPNVQQSQASGTGLSMATLRSGLSLEGLEEKMFADLLAQASTTQKQMIGRKSSYDSSSASNDSKATGTTGLAETSSNDDRAALRALMQRIRQDAKTLYQNRQRIRHVDKNASQAGDEDRPANKPATDKVSENADETSSVTQETVLAAQETADPLNSYDDYDAATDVMTEDEAMALAASLLMDNNARSFVEAVTPDKTTGTVLDETETKALLDDLITSEQAALLLLSRLMHEKAEKLMQGVSDTGTVADAAMESGVEVMAPIADPVKGIFTGAAKAQKGSPQNVLSLGEPLDPEADAGLSAPFANGNAFGNVAASSVSASAKEKPQETPAEGTSTPNTDDDFLTMYNANGGVPANAALKTPFDPVAGKNGAAAEIGGIGDVASTASSRAEGTGNSLIAEGVKPAGSYDFASQLSATRATRGGSVGLPSAVEQVALQLHKAVKEGSDQMTVHLRPADLGRIEIKLSFSSDNMVQGTVVADNPATLDLLSKDVGSLQRALQDAGLRADPGCLQFSLRGEGQTNFFNANSNGNGSGGQASSGSASMMIEETDVSNDTDAEIYYLSPGRINFRV